MTLAFVVYLGVMLLLVAGWSLPARKAAIGPVPTAHAGTQAAVASILIFTLLIGGRYNVGGDFFGYIDYYRLTSLNDNYRDVVFEPGFLLLIQLLKFFSLPDRSIIIASSFLQIALFSLWLRKHPQIAPFAIFTFITLLLLDVNNIVRQGIAFFAILLALSAIAERRWASFIGWLLFACLFHRSAVIVFPIGLGLFWLRVPRVSLQVGALIFSYVFFGLFFNQVVGLFTFLSPFLGYSSYSDISRADLAFGRGNGSSLNLGIYLWPVVDLAVILFSGKVADHYKIMGYRIFHNFYLVAALLQPVANAWDFLPFARGLFYFVAMRSICIAFVLHYCLAVSQRPRDIVIAVGLSTVFLLWLIVAISRGAAWSAPYQFF
ncbi:hypothetical protein ASE89_18700 [Sphingomonas sp. Leaf30]|jgi:hypothetical protein|nr:hypothetical protein ASE89_18700 [Sphingomonas sp. Leaf30]